MHDQDFIKIIEKSREVIKKRNVNLASVTLASLVASLSELGILTQGTVASLAKYFTPRICAYMLEKGIVDPNKPLLENLKKVFEEYAFTEEDYEVVASDGELRVEIVTDRCKVCPKGVGGAEIPGSACPVPYFLSICLSILTNERWEPKKMKVGNRIEVVHKEGGKCKIELEKL